MKQEVAPQLFVTETTRKKLAHQIGEKERIALDSHAIGMFLKLKKLISQVDKEVSDEGFVLKRLSGSIDQSGPFYFKLVIKGVGEYFIKELKSSYFFKGGGVYDMLATQRAEEALRKAGVEDVEVLKYVLSFESENIKYSVAPWDERLQRTLMGVGSDRPVGEEWESLLRRIEKIQKILWPLELGDIWRHNMAYDEKTKKLILFDLKSTK